MFGSRFLLKLVIVAVVVVLALGVVAYATTGTIDDPLVSLSYLEKTFMPAVEQRLSPMIESAKKELSDTFDNKIQSLAGTLSNSIIANSLESEPEPDSEYVTASLEAGKTIVFSAGAQVLFLEGGASITSGSINDTTAGQATKSELTVNHLYIASAESAAQAGDEGAVFLINGLYSIE